MGTEALLPTIMELPRERFMLLFPHGLAAPRQGAPNTRLENYIQLRRVAPTTTGDNTKTLHSRVFQQTVRRSFMILIGASVFDSVLASSISSLSTAPVIFLARTFSASKRSKTAKLA